MRRRARFARALLAGAALYATRANADPPSAVRSASPRDDTAIGARPWHVTADVAASVNVASVAMGYGAVARVRAGWVAWSATAAAGSLDAGVWVAYHHAPYSQLGFLGPDERASGAEHRAHVWLVLGHTLHVLPSRRLTVGLHAVVGWSHLTTDGTFLNERLGVGGRYIAAGNALALGLALSLGVRVSHRVGVVAHAVGHPFAYGWRVTGYTAVALGLDLTL